MIHHLLQALDNLGHLLVVRWGNARRGRDGDVQIQGRAHGLRGVDRSRTRLSRARLGSLGLQKEVGQKALKRDLIAQAAMIKALFSRQTVDAVF